MRQLNTCYDLEPRPPPGGASKKKQHFLQEEESRIATAIDSVASALAPKSAQALTVAIYFSLQCRADFLLETHLPSLTRNLTKGVDAALRRAYSMAFGADLLDPNGQVAGEQDPTFIRDLMELKANAGGGGYRRTERRAPFLNNLNKALPQMAGNGDSSALWPSLSDVLGSAIPHTDIEGGRWATFFQSGSQWAAEMQSEIERVTSLYTDALAAAGRDAATTESTVFKTPVENFGANVKKNKLHKEMFDEIRKHEAEALRVRASKLLPSDQRKLAFEQSRTCRFSNVLFTSWPSSHARFTNPEFHTAVQSVVGAPLSVLRPYLNFPIKSNRKGETPPKVDPYGNALRKLSGAPGGGTTRNHHALVDLLSFWLHQAGVPHRGGRHGKPRSCKDLFTHIDPNAAREEGQRVLQSIIPDLVIDGRSLDTRNEGSGHKLLASVRTLADIKTKSCDSRYAQDSSGRVGAVVNKKQSDVNKDYHDKARELDSSLITADPNREDGYEKELDTYGQEGMVVAPVLGAFGEMSEHVYDITDLAADLLAEKHCSTYNDEPKDVKTMFIQRIRRSVGLTAHLGWARLLLDRLRDLVQIPGASTHTSGWDAEPDDEDEHERDNYLNPEFIQRHAH